MTGNKSFCHSQSSWWWCRDVSANLSCFNLTSLRLHEGGRTWAICQSWLSNKSVQTLNALHIVPSCQQHGWNPKPCMVDRLGKAGPCINTRRASPQCTRCNKVHVSLLHLDCLQKKARGGNIFGATIHIHLLATTSPFSKAASSKTSGRGARGWAQCFLHALTHRKNLHVVASTSFLLRANLKIKKAGGLEGGRKAPPVDSSLQQL